MGKKVFTDRGYIGRSSECVLAYDKYVPFCDTVFDSTNPAAYMSEKYAAYLISAAEKLLDTPYPMLPASLYMQFSRNGNRSNFEDPYFKRRSMALTFLLAELCEKNGRFTDRAIDGVWAIMEESSWVIPAHSFVELPVNYAESIRRTDKPLIDLFAATTGGTLAWIYYLGRGIFDEVSPTICKRILDQLRVRILDSFYNYENDHWQGARGGGLNNWTPWITSNVLTVISLCETDSEKRAFGVDKCMTILDRFTEPYPDDGGCDEGPNYWNAAGASYYDCIELLYDLSGGKINVFDEPLVRNMCEYITSVRLADGLYLNFADASSKCSPDFRIISRMGRRMCSENMRAFGADIMKNADSINIDTSFPYRTLRNLIDPLPENIGYIPPKRIWYPDLQVSITHSDGGMCLAFKGGHNAESHNHNDVGSFVITDGTTPLFIDAGVDRYTRKTFSAERYTIWSMRSAYHNLPMIGGIEQKNGREYRAEIVSYDEDSAQLTLELKAAYPADAGIISYVRSAGLDGEAVKIVDALHLDGEAVKIVDALHLDGEKEVTFNYLLVDEPKLENNRAILPSGHVMTFDEVLEASLEAVDVADTKIGKEWQREKLWRLSLTARVKDAAFAVTVERG